MDVLETLGVPLLIGLMALPLALIYLRDKRARYEEERQEAVRQETAHQATNQALSLELSRQLAECQAGREALRTELDKLRAGLADHERRLREHEENMRTVQARHAKEVQEREHKLQEQEAKIQSLQETLVAIAKGGVTHVAPARSRERRETERRETERRDTEGTEGTQRARRKAGEGESAKKEESEIVRAAAAETRRAMVRELAAARQNLARLELEQTERGTDVYRTNQIEGMKARIRELEVALDDDNLPQGEGSR